MHLAGVTIEIYYNARSYKRQKTHVRTYNFINILYCKTHFKLLFKTFYVYKLFWRSVSYILQRKPS